LENPKEGYMEGYPLKSFSGFAIAIDLRNFSEIARRLLIQKRKPFSNSLKWRIYTVIFDFLSETLETMIESSNGALFDYKHTGDGFLFLTRHHRNIMPNSLDGFLFLLDIYLCLDKSVTELNLRVIDLLKNNLKIVRGNRYLRYIEALFRNESGKRWRQHIDFSVGAHCGTIFYKTCRNKKMFLGNTINQAYRFEALSNTFSDYNLFFSEAISNRLSKDMKNPGLYSKISQKCFKNLERIEIKGLGPTTVQTIRNSRIEHVREQLMHSKTFTDSH
jgi:hypothetical protein